MPRAKRKQIHDVRPSLFLQVSPNIKFVQVASSILPMQSGTAGATGSGDIRIIPVYKKSGLLLSTGVGESGSNARITERADKSYSTQIYYSASYGATRMEEAKVTVIYVGDDNPVLS